MSYSLVNIQKEVLRFITLGLLHLDATFVILFTQFLEQISAASKPADEHDSLREESVIDNAIRS